MPASTTDKFATLVSAIAALDDLEDAPGNADQKRIAEAQCRQKILSAGFALLGEFLDNVSRATVALETIAGQEGIAP